MISKPKGKRYLDLHFFCRIMLESYVYEKLGKMITIFGQFESAKLIQKIKSQTVPTSIFILILCQNYPEASMSEIIKLYSTSMNLGGGIVDKESFYVASQELCFFKYEMKLNLLSKVDYLKILKSKKESREFKFEFEVINDASRSLKKYKTTKNFSDKNDFELELNVTKKMIDKIASKPGEKLFIMRKRILEAAEQLGSESLLQEYLNMLSIVSDLVNPRWQYKAGSLIHLSLLLQETESKILNMWILCGNYRDLGIKDEFEILENITKKMLEKEKTLEIVKKVRRIRFTRDNASVRKIQNFLKNKFDKWYQLLGHLLNLREKKRSEETENSIESSKDKKEKTEDEDLKKNELTEIVEEVEEKVVKLKKKGRRRNKRKI